MSSRDLQFDPADMKRLNLAAQQLATTPAEIIVFATRQALDELEGYARDADALRAYYEGVGPARQAAESAAADWVREPQGAAP